MSANGVQSHGASLYTAIHDFTLKPLSTLPVKQRFLIPTTESLTEQSNSLSRVLKMKWNQFKTTLEGVGILKIHGEELRVQNDELKKYF